ncbi:MAG: hypothetical protein AAF850_13470 [Pseudomonadota bacterium]
MIAFYPPVASPEDAADTCARAAWYFRGAMEAGAEVIVFAANAAPARPSSVFYIESDDTAPQPRLTEAADMFGLLRRADVVIAWDRASRFSAPAWLRQKCRAGDELCDFGAADEWMEAAPPIDDISAHQQRFDALADNLRESGASALVLGAGPSLSTAADPKFDPPKTLNVYGGSAIDNDAVIHARPPHIIALADVAGQAGPSKTAARRRDRLYSVLRKHRGAHVLTPERYWRSLKAWWPEDLVERVIAVPTERERPIGTSLSDVFSYEPTRTVLTTFLIPAAAALSNDIRFAGVDGANGGGGAGKDDDQEADKDCGAVLWRHDRKIDYTADLLEATLTHSRSHVVALGEYYDSHWRRVALDLQALRSKGWRVAAPGPLATAPDSQKSHTPSARVQTAGSLSSSRFVFTRQARELAGRAFGVLDALQDRPRVAVSIAMALGACSGAVYSLGMVYAIIIGAVAASALCIGYLSLRWRMNRLIAADDRARSSAEDRTAKALAARIDALEKKVATFESGHVPDAEERGSEQ